MTQPQKRQRNGNLNEKKMALQQQQLSGWDLDLNLDQQYLIFIMLALMTVISICHIICIRDY
jgi:hypothetical protein